MSPESDADHRRNRRLSPDHQETLRVRLPWYGGQHRETICVMVDASANGAGILITERLAYGTEVAIEGEIEINAVRYRIAGTARVVNSRMEDYSLYRIGLQFMEMSWDRVEPQDAAQPVDLASSKAEPERGRAS